MAQRCNEPRKTSCDPSAADALEATTIGRRETSFAPSRMTPSIPSPGESSGLNHWRKRGARVSGYGQHPPAPGGFPHPYVAPAKAGPNNSVSRATIVASSPT